MSIFGLSWVINFDPSAHVVQFWFNHTSWNDDIKADRCTFFHQLWHAPRKFFRAGVTLKFLASRSQDSRNMDPPRPQHKWSCNACPVRLMAHGSLTGASLKSCRCSSLIRLSFWYYLRVICNPFSLYRRPSLALKNDILRNRGTKGGGCHGNVRLATEGTAQGSPTFAAQWDQPFENEAVDHILESRCVLHCLPSNGYHFFQWENSNGFPGRLKESFSDPKYSTHSRSFGWPGRPTYPRHPNWHQDTDKPRVVKQPVRIQAMIPTSTGRLEMAVWLKWQLGMEACWKWLTVVLHIEL